MSRYALMQAGRCATVVEQESAPAIDGVWLDITGLHVGPGWAWDGSTWTAPAAQVPAEVTMRQAREALIDAGLIDAVDAAIAAMPEGITKRKALNAWEYSSAVQRHNGLVSELAPTLGLTDAQIDALFIAAGNID